MKLNSVVMAVLPALLLAVVFVAAGQASTELPCRHDCFVPINLSDQAGQRPVAPDWFRVVGDEQVDFNVQGIRGGGTRTIVSLEQAALVDAPGNPIYPLNLQSGSNRYPVRPFDDGACIAPDDWRYEVINVGTPQRPRIINSPRIIIDPS